MHPAGSLKVTVWQWQTIHNAAIYAITINNARMKHYVDADHEYQTG